MADPNVKPASFAEAKELARRNMLAVQAQAENEATQTEQQSTDDDDDIVLPSQKSPAPDEDDSEDADDASTDDDDEEEDDEDEDESDDDSDDDGDGDTDDDGDEEDSKPDPKRKPSRRSKRIDKLKAEIRDLKAGSADQEERLLKRIQEEQARRAALEAAERQRQAEDRQIEAEMAEYLGSDDEYRTAVRAALNGDPFEAEKARAWDERREIFGKLNRRAEMRVNQRAAEIFWQSTEGLPGVDKEILEKADFGAVLKHLHEAGFAVAERKAQAEIAKRDARIAKLEAQVKTKKIKRAATSTKTPLEGGTPARPREEKSIYQQAMLPDGRIDRTKFEELRRQAQRSQI